MRERGGSVATTARGAPLGSHGAPRSRTAQMTGAPVAVLLSRSNRRQPVVPRGLRRSRALSQPSGHRMVHGPASGWMVGQTLLLASLFVVAFGCSRQTPDLLEQEVEQLRAWTLSPNAHLVNSAPIQRGTWSVETSWALDIAQPWPEYRASLERGLPVSYWSGSSSADELSFVKAVDDDRMVRDHHGALAWPSAPRPHHVRCSGRVK